MQPRLKIKVTKETEVSMKFYRGYNFRGKEFERLWVGSPHLICVAGCRTSGATFRNQYNLTMGIISDSAIKICTAVIL